MSNVTVFSEGYEKLSEIDWDFPEASQDALARIHPYPARFINDIPKHLIESLGCPSGSAVLDPFCGSGTTLVEAQRHGLESVGVDVNPIACLISRVKTQSLATEDFTSVVSEVANCAKDLFERQITIPVIPNIDHWFGKQIQKALSALLLSCRHKSDGVIGDALLLALSSIIVKVSNQESDTRYAAICKNTTPEDVFERFVAAGERIAKAKTSLHSPKSDVILHDILTLNDRTIGRSIGLVITSPPYPNAYEYWLYHKYRMWWLGYNPIEVRSYEIGARPHYQKRNGQTEKDFANQMERVFGLLTRVLVNGGHICFVVGRSIIRGRVIDNGELIRNVGNHFGLLLVADILRRISLSSKSFNPKYGKIMEEHILVFRKVL